MKKLLSTLLFLFVIAMFSLSAQNRVYAPTLMDPSDGDDGQMPDVILNWGAVAGSGGIVMYEVQLDTSLDFTQPPMPQSEFTGYQSQHLLFGQQYYWRVRAIEGSEVSDWSDAFTFTIFESIALNKPSDNAVDQTPNVELKAKDRIGANLITGVEEYDFQADTSANFDSPLLYEGSSETFTKVVSFLHFGETYYWRARASHASDKSAWSDTRSFSVIPTVVLDDPANAATDLGLENELVWDAITGVIDYTIQVADEETFSSPLTMIIEDNMYLTDGYLSFDMEYFWRVRANHATDTSIWSEERSFTTTSTVHLSLPANNASDIAINPLFKWDEITGVDFYHIQYNDMPTFDELCCEVQYIDGSENFFQVITNLDKGTTYYWRCRTMQGIDTTVWSDVWSFTTQDEIGINETGFNASNINIYPNPSHGKLFIDINGEENAEVSIYIMDLLGQVHIEESVVFNQGNSSRTFDLSQLANGLYIVKMLRGDQSYSHKITIHK